VSVASTNPVCFGSEGTGCVHSVRIYCVTGRRRTQELLSRHICQRRRVFHLKYTVHCRCHQTRVVLAETKSAMCGCYFHVYFSSPLNTDFLCLPKNEDFDDVFLFILLVLLGICVDDLIHNLLR